MATTGAFPWVADLYDLYVTFEDDIPFWLEEARRAGGPVLELMCGTGRVSLPLVRAGAAVTGVDLSEAMLARFGKKLAAEGLSADLRGADVVHLDLPGRDFALAILAFGSFSEVVAGADRERALRRIRGHLAPGGRFVCALHNPAQRRATLDGVRHPYGSFPRPDGNGTFRVLVERLLAPGSTTVHCLQTYEFLDAAGRVEEVRHLDVRYGIVEPAEFERMAEAVGFRLVSVVGDFARTPFDAAVSPYAIFTLER